MVASGSVLLACGAIVGAQGFIAAPRGPVRLSSHFPNYVEQTRGAGVTPVSSSEGFRDTVLNLSGVVWDAVESQMEKGKDAEAETLSQLGKALMELDEKVFEKFRSPTSSYLSTLEEVEESKASESTKSAEPVAEKPVAAATAAPAPPSAVEAKVEAPVKPAPKVDSAAAKGGVDLQRPAAVEGVIASFQRKAVESYKSLMPQMGAQPEVVSEETRLSILSSDAMTLEKTLEGLLKDSGNSPKALPDVDRQKMGVAVEALSKMTEASWPVDSGVWSLAYASGGRAALSAALGSKRSRFLKVAGSVIQKVFPAGSGGSVEIEAPIRLRLTPLRWKVKQTGTYEMQKGSAANNGTVTITFGQPRSWRAPFRRQRQVTARMAYSGKKWRICEVGGGNVLAFRKVEEQEGTATATSRS